MYTKETVVAKNWELLQGGSSQVYFTTMTDSLFIIPYVCTILHFYGNEGNIIQQHFLNTETQLKL